MGTKNDPGCFQRALHDEPLFTLLARDPCAAEAVRFWVTLRQALIGSGEKPLDDHNMLEDALRTASEMRVWRDDATDPATWGPGTPRWKHEDQQPEPSPSVETLQADLAACRRELEKADDALFKRAHIRSEMLPDGEGRLAAILEKRLLTFEDDATVSLKVRDIRRIIAESEQGDAELKAALRDAVERQDAKDRTQEAPGDGHMLPYEDWIVAKRNAMPLGNRFLIADRDGELVFWEKKNYATPGLHPDNEDWTGYYPLRHSLQREMLWCAYEDWRNSTSHTVATIKRLTTDERTDWQAATEIANELIHWLGDRKSDRAEELRELAERVRSLGPSPFIGYDLADRMETKLRDVAKELRAYIHGRPWPDTRKREMFEFCDRLTNCATELSAGKAKAALLRNRRADPPLGAPYTPDPRATPSADPYKDLADSIVGQDRDVKDGKINPHVQRFSSFTEGKAWACGRGISAEHVPATLDALTDRGWFLAYAYGSSGANAVMVFRRMFNGGKVSHPSKYRVGDGGGEVVDLGEGQKP